MKIYLVGGAVRDMLLGVTDSNDRDWVVVGSSPAEMISRGFIQVGADFPVFLHPQTNEEYALARVERKTGAGYNGFSTETNGVSLQEDLMRRDLTINAIAFDPESMSYVDPTGGLKDLIEKKLRHCSDAFSEDPLRVIRLARFAARMKDFYIDTETKQLCQKLVEEGRLNEISYERFWLEIEKASKVRNFNTFFVVLQTFGVFEHVNFFKEVFESFSKVLQWSMVGAHAWLTHEERFNITIAGSCKSTIASVKGVKGEIAQMHEDLKGVQGPECGKVVVRSKIWIDSPRSKNMKTILLFMMSREKMNDMIERLSKVSSKDFPDKIGKDLGEAMFQERLKIANWYVEII